MITKLTTRLAFALALAQLAGGVALAKERRYGFAYVEPLYAALARYEKQRDRYPTFVHFYPELVEVFRALAQGDDARASE